MGGVHWWRRQTPRDRPHSAAGSHVVGCSVAPPPPWAYLNGAWQCLGCAARGPSSLRKQRTEGLGRAGCQNGRGSDLTGKLRRRAAPLWQQGSIACRLSTAGLQRLGGFTRQANKAMKLTRSSASRAASTCRPGCARPGRARPGRAGARRPSQLIASVRQTSRGPGDPRYWRS
jgi:hypothetical protein